MSGQATGGAALAQARFDEPWDRTVSRTLTEAPAGGLGTSLTWSHDIKALRCIGQHPGQDSLLFLF